MKEEAGRLSIHGWCHKADHGFEGEIQGSEPHLDKMGTWLTALGASHEHPNDFHLGDRKALSEPLYATFVVED